jgi:hypothetical protein
MGLRGLPKPTHFHPNIVLNPVLLRCVLQRALSWIAEQHPHAFVCAAPCRHAGG